MIKYVDEIPLSGKKVLIRVDFNVPLTESGKVADDNRIKGALSTIRHVISEGGRVILCSHLGRPKGERNERFSLKPVADRLGQLLGQEVTLAPDCIGPQVEDLVSGMKDGDVLLLENLRFHHGETKNDPSFAKALASLADVYVNDAFAVSHREHASVTGVPALTGQCAAGFLIKKELDYFNKAMVEPDRPLAAILGGAKVSSKLGAIKNIMNLVDKILIGGAMANTFLVAQGFSVGNSLVESDLVETAREIFEEARDKKIGFYLPVDAVLAKEISSEAQIRIAPVQEIAEDEMILDIGQATIDLFREALYNARTIVWNGPMGAFEKVPFSLGTMSLARTVGSSNALSIVGGGDTGLAVQMAGESDNISYISTGGGAFLMLLEGKELPGITALKECG